MRGSVRREARIACSADRVWEVLGRPELIHHWFPGIDDCTVEGTTRTITLATGIPLPEEILTNDPLLRRFQYRLAGGFFKDHLGTIDVIELGPDESLVVYASDCDPAAMSLVLGGATGGALGCLKHQLETGAGPAIDAIEEAR